MPDLKQEVQRNDVEINILVFLPDNTIAVVEIRPTKSLAMVIHCKKITSDHARLSIWRCVLGCWRPVSGVMVLWLITFIPTLRLDSDMMCVYFVPIVC